jgi:anti-anti-sigma factor
MSEPSDPKFIRTEQQGNVLVITPLFTQAVFNEPNSSLEWEQVQEQLDSPSTEQLIVDLGEIPYFGSTVLEWMAQLWKRVKVKGGRLAVIRPSAISKEVLSTARLEKLWGVFETRDQAFTWLARPQS